MVLLNVETWYHAGVDAVILADIETMTSSTWTTWKNH